MRTIGIFCTALLVLLLSLGPVGTASAQEAPAGAATESGGFVPGGALGNQSDSELWRMIRQGAQGNVSIPDKKAGILIQSEGETWRALRNGPLSTAGIWVMLGMVVLLALFFALRGRIKIEHGPSGQLVERFNLIERIGHWLTAVSFIILAITGLNILYGRYVLPQVIGKEAFSTISQAGKWVHDYVAFAFMAGLVMIFVLWVMHNLPSRHDLIWLAKGGGLFTKGSHPSSRKFNAGQKIIFWVTILGGLSLSLTGWALLDPFQYAMFAKTFQFLNIFGFNLPTEITVVQEQQLAQLWHGAISLFMIAVILAHIYIGSMGMEGAFAAMGSGKVDVNWAREHHDLWLEEVEKAAADEAAKVPAE